MDATAIASRLKMTITISSALGLLALAVSHAAGQNLTVQDPGETITLALPPGTAAAPADQFLGSVAGASEAAAAIPLLALDDVVQGRVALVGHLSCKLGCWAYEYYTSDKSLAVLNICIDTCGGHRAPQPLAIQRSANVSSVLSRAQPTYTTSQGLPTQTTMSN